MLVVQPKHRLFTSKVHWLVALLFAGGLALSSSPCHAALPPKPAADVTPSPEAREQFQVGVTLLQDPDGARYEEAFQAFYRAYELSPSWKILGNLGLCAMKIERFGDAIEAYERYLVDAGGNLNDQERTQIQRDLTVMKATSGTVTLTFSGASEIKLKDVRMRGSAVLSNEYQVPSDGRLVLKLASGSHELVATSAGKSISFDLDVKAGSKLERAISFEAESAGAAVAPGAAGPSSAGQASGEQPAAAAPAPNAATAPAGSMSTLRTTGLIVGGVGVAALIGGGVTAFLGSNQRKDLESRCPGNRCPAGGDDEEAQFESDKDSLRTMQTLTNVFLIGGGVLAATGVTLYVLGGPGTSEQVAVTPLLTNDTAALTAWGSF